MLLGIYVYTYMHVATIKMEAMNLKESKGVYGRVWRIEMEGRNYEIIL